MLSVLVGHDGGTKLCMNYWNRQWKAFETSGSMAGGGPLNGLSDRDSEKCVSWNRVLVLGEQWPALFQYHTYLDVSRVLPYRNGCSVRHRAGEHGSRCWAEG